MENTTDVKYERALKLICKCDSKYKRELYESTFERAKDVLSRPLTAAIDGWSNYGGIRAVRNRNKNMRMKEIAAKAEAKGKDKNYDYEMMVKGFSILAFCLFIIITIIFISLVYKINMFYDMFFSGIKGAVTIIALVIFLLYGIMSIVKPTQRWLLIGRWKLFKSKFKFTESILPAVGPALPDGSEGIRKTNEAVLYDERFELYFKTNVYSFGYNELGCIYETDNLFVIMVQDDYIYSFQKNDMTEDEIVIAREILSPYYENQYKNL